MEKMLVFPTPYTSEVGIKQVDSDLHAVAACCWQKLEFQSDNTYTCSCGTIFPAKTIDSNLDLVPGGRLYLSGDYALSKDGINKERCRKWIQGWIGRNVEEVEVTW